MNFGVILENDKIIPKIIIDIVRILILFKYIYGNFISFSFKFKKNDHLVYKYSEMILMLREYNIFFPN